MKEFWICFVPLFVAVDAIGVLPLFISMTEGIEREKLHRIILQSILTATIVALVFMAIGKVIFQLLGISVADFMIAGGVMLFVFSLNDLLSFETKKRRHLDAESVGAVPIGVPLIVGPGVLTTSLILLDQHGTWATGSALLVNILFAGIVFWLSEAIYKILGKIGSKIISKLASLLMAAIAIMMIRKGIVMCIQAFESARQMGS